MRFYTRIDGWVYLIGLLFLWQTVRITYLAITQPSGLTISFALIFVLFFTLILLPVFLSTYYEVQETELFIHFGILFRISIPYETIQRLCPVKGFTFCFGLSVNRLILHYCVPGKLAFLVLSPKEREKFIQEVQKKKPKIDTNTGQDDSSAKAVTQK